MIIIEKNVQNFVFWKKYVYLQCSKKQRIMRNYMITLERRDKQKKYRYFRFECQADNFYRALEIAVLKIEKLKAQKDINYEIIKIEKSDR